MAAFDPFVVVHHVLLPFVAIVSAVLVAATVADGGRRHRRC